ncbi:MAG: F0F1 ATP synthase subunit epsilon [Pararhodobacter sp.]
MAETMQFDLVSPERMLASVAASAVQVPGADGDFTAMPGHAPFLSTLRPGLVRATTATGELAYVVTGGFAEVTAEAVSLLAERGIPQAEMTQALLDTLTAEARTMRDTAEGDAADQATRRLSDLAVLGQQLGLSVSAG